MKFDIVIEAEIKVGHWSSGGDRISNPVTVRIPYTIYGDNWYEAYRKAVYYTEHTVQASFKNVECVGVKNNWE